MKSLGCGRLPRGASRLICGTAEPPPSPPARPRDETSAGPPGDKVDGGLLTQIAQIVPEFLSFFSGFVGHFPLTSALFPTPLGMF